MNKLASISFAIIIVLSGMHFSIATHICGGEVATVKWSFSGRKATCGMEDSKSSCPVNNSIASDCCQNKIMIYAVDKNYSPSTFQFKEVTKKLLHIWYIPLNFSLLTLTASDSLFTNVIPPGKLLTCAGNLAGICVFRL